MDKVRIVRKTLETSVELSLDIDRDGTRSISTSCGFLDHMLNSMAVHGGFSLEVQASGDVDVDYHHVVEDVGICFGDALSERLGNREGIFRYGSAIIPMDESLCLVAVDISGRPYLAVSGLPPEKRIGAFDVDLIPEFLRAFANHSAVTLHVSFLNFGNAHHAVEALFKGLGLSLSQAARRDPGATVAKSAKGRL